MSMRPSAMAHSSAQSALFSNFFKFIFLRCDFGFKSACLFFLQSRVSSASSSISRHSNGKGCSRLSTNAEPKKSHATHFSRMTDFVSNGDRSAGEFCFEDKVLNLRRVGCLRKTGFQLLGSEVNTKREEDRENIRVPASLCCQEYSCLRILNDCSYHLGTAI